ncbi:hypothetical protein EYE40_13140 [Glaciihabitans arcticus]|uniref:alpha-L-rhamnosidase n=1 Tax=Glaciihabitans arcticus TaxID=2668039 RepID=A0A4Q9GZK0_9MICO|nr:family 78 glycoside hydrolase catalytic domain [Glaciihabitans arcticus]TBN58263.1 hypothetical protein EYE40_13140 [Glaciihabitans arcticus]
MTIGPPMKTSRLPALALAMILALTGAVTTALPAVAADVVTLSGLAVEKKVEPVGIDVEKPRFSWITSSTTRDISQESYRLRVSENADATGGWDSGVVASDASANVEYTGPALDPATRYSWRVDVVTSAGAATATSEFRTGLYDAADWQNSAWIGNDRVQETAAVSANLTGASWIHPPYTGSNTPPGYFRKAFTLTAGKTVESAELVMAADSGFAAFLNGTQVSSRPATADAWKLAARTAVQVQPGANQFAVRLNNSAKTYGAVVGKLTILFTDGSTQTVSTDATWSSSQTATSGWHLSSFAQSGWVAAAARAVYGAGPWGAQVVVPAVATPDTGLNLDTASWILAGAGSTNPVPSTLFRKVIPVSTTKQVAWAQLAVSGDQVVDTYWNGELVAQNLGTNDEWQTADVVNVAARGGDNVLAIALTTPGNAPYGGVLARVRIGYTDGTSTEAMTDTGFLSKLGSLATAPAGWTTVGFDTTGWTNARDMGLYRGLVYGDRVAVPSLSATQAELSLTGSSWIWTPDSNPPPGEDRAFRKTIDTPPGKTATKAEIIITADDSFRLSVNGRLVGFTEGAVNEWQSSKRFTTDLAASRNVFAVRTTNGPGSAAGLVAAIRVSYSDGSSQIVRTGADWKGSKVIPNGFEATGFDDSAWGVSVVQAAFGSGPWGTGVRPPSADVNPAPLLRKQFAVTGAVRNATLFYAAGGYADFRVNGAAIGDDILAPGFTDYDDTVQYATADLTDQVDQGANAIGVELGRGFYGMTGSNVWNWEKPTWHDEPVVRAVLRIEYSDGRVENVITDDSWSIHDGPTRFDDLYGGELYDASFEQNGFDTVGFNDASWDDASEVRGPRGELVNQRQQPIRVTEEIAAQSMTEPTPGTFVVKFPRMLAGNVRITAEGDAGDQIRFQYGEKLRTTGLVNFDNNGGFGSGFQTDRFVLAGTGAPETWQAKFSYKGFQYIQVTGWPGGATPPLSAFTALVLHTDAAETGSFESSDDIMNKTHRAVVDTLYNNIHGIPTDTPMFEKNGWTGDAAVGAEMFMMNIDTHELFAKWMRDLHESRNAAGAPMVIAPSSAQWGDWGVAPVWHSAYVMIPWWLYQYGGDKRVIEEQYAGMKAYVDLEYGRSPGGIADSRLGDWVSPEASPAGSNAPEDTKVSATAYLYEMLVTMQKTATLTGRTADATQFGARAAVVKDAFNARFLDEAGGYYKGSGDRGYRQTHNVLALAFDLAPDAAMAQRVADSIVVDVRAKGTTLNTGVLGTKYLLPVLTRYGHEDVAYELAVQTAYPSWGYQINNGATSMWEHWSTEARSLGHYFLGTVDDWFYHDVAGIRASETSGYRDISIAPKITGQALSWAKATTQTPFGPVSSDWRTTATGLSLDVNVPVGSVATVRVPASSIYAVTEGGTPLADAPGVRSATIDGADVVVVVGSGAYAFSVNTSVGELGVILERIDDLEATIVDLVGNGELTNAQRNRLVTALDAQRALVFEAIAKLGDGERVGAARDVAKLVTSLDGLDENITALDTSTASKDALAEGADAIRTLVYTVVSSLLGVTADASLAPAGVKPGESTTATVRLQNGGTAVLGAVLLEVTPPTDDWTVTPSGERSIATALEAGATASADVRLTSPADALPGATPTTAHLAYGFDGVRILVDVPVATTVDSALTVSSATIAPTTVQPGDAATLTVTLANSGAQSTTGSLVTTVPAGWTTPLATPVTLVPAGGTVTLKVPVFVPLSSSTASLAAPIEFDFRSGSVVHATGSVPLAVALAPLGTSYDHADLGEPTSETAHNIAASGGLGNRNSEAGLTRRYAGHLVDYSSFEFDMTVEAGEPFVIRSIETYDRSQTKRYKIYVDGQEVHLRQFPHTTGAGTETFDVLVPARYATDGTVHLKFETQTDHSFYDPSIADVWTLPVSADSVAPQVSAVLDPASPDRATGWYREDGVSVELLSRDDRSGAPGIRYSIDGAAVTDYTAPLALSGEGVQGIVYSAVDAAGNRSANAELTVRIDTVAPVTTATLGSTFTAGIAKGAGSIAFAATDATSGLKRTQYRVDGGAWTTGASLTLSAIGQYSIDYRSVDVAGNVEAERTVEAKIIAVPNPPTTPTHPTNPKPPKPPKAPSANPGTGGGGGSSADDTDDEEVTEPTAEPTAEPTPAPEPTTDAPEPSDPVVAAPDADSGFDPGLIAWIVAGLLLLLGGGGAALFIARRR